MFFFSCEFKPGKVAIFDVFAKFSYELKPKEILSVFYTAYMLFLTKNSKREKFAVFKVFF